MASWAAADERRSARRAHFVLRLGGHVVPDRELLVLASRLAEQDAELAHQRSGGADEQGEARRQLEAARVRVTRDLALLAAAVQRSSAPSH